MSIVSHLHHLFNPETCSILTSHTLRWKDRPTPVSSVSEPQRRSLGARTTINPDSKTLPL